MPPGVQFQSLPEEHAHAHLLACHDCDALYQACPLEPGQSITCPHCNARLITCRSNSTHRAAAFAISAAVLFFVANFFPFIQLEAAGQGTQIVLAQSVSELQAHGSLGLAIAVAVFILGAPSIALGGLLFILLPLLFGRRLPGALQVCRVVYRTDPWNMIEVFLIGALVSLLKLGGIATVTLGIAFWAFIGLIICLTATLASLDRHELWDQLEQAK